MPVRRFLRVIAIVAIVSVVGGTAASAKVGGGNGGGGTSLNPQSGKSKAPRSQDYHDTLNRALKDIQAYWKDEFPTLYGAPYQPVNKIIAAGPGTGIPKCSSHDSGKYDEVKGNAFYCFGANFVAYDDSQLFPQLFRDYGAFSVALVLAHEWGHAIQDRASNQQHQTILQELQADCFAGSWVKRVADGKSAVKLSKGNLDAALSAYLQFRDTPGGSPDANSAHGSAFDRVSAFQQGFEGGADVCKPYFDSPPVIVEATFTSAQEAASGGNLPADQVIPASVELLNAFYSAVEPAYKPLAVSDISSYNSTKPKTLPKCGGSKPPVKELKNRIFYCLPDNYFAFDEPYLQHVYNDIGDFGVATLVANTWATYVQSLQKFPGVDTNADNAVLGADCYTGGFAAAMFNKALLVDPATGQPKYTLSPGDLDKTLQAFIDYAAARGVGKNLDVTFIRLKAFRDGFFNGYQSCASYATPNNTSLSPSG
jgi:predicted metalloprotease